MRRNAKTLAAVGLLGLGAGVFCATLYFSTIAVPQEAELPEPPKHLAVEAPAKPADLPARLRIPALGIDANVQHVGVKPNGVMANPSNFTDVGWYKYGTTPGLTGSAVMAGHVDNGLALAGVFKRLNELKKGDAIEVETAGGGVQRFVVEEVVVYPYQTVPAERVFNRKDAVRLNLITCEGSWLPSARTYDERLIVYAVAA